MSINLYIPKNQFVEIINSKLVDEIITKQSVIKQEFSIYTKRSIQVYNDTVKNTDNFWSNIFDKKELRQNFNNFNYSKSENLEWADKLKSIESLIHNFQGFVDQLVEYRNLIEKNTLLNPIPIPYPSRFILLLFEKQVKFYPTFLDILYHFENNMNFSICSSFYKNDNGFQFLEKGKF